MSGAATTEIGAPPALPSFRSRLLRVPGIWVGGALIFLFVFAAIFADVISPYGPDARFGQNEPPSAEHWLGTDSNEKDVLTRVIHGSRLSLIASITSISCAVVIGVGLGILAGYNGGRIDMLVMRAIDIWLSFPSLLIAFLVIAALRPGWPAVIIAVALINVPVFARQVRAEMLALKHAAYAEAAIAAGATPWYMVLFVYLPAVSGTIWVLATLGLGHAILEVAGLSFLGIAGDPSNAEWGAMLVEAKENLHTTVWPAVAAGVSISLTILGFNLFGDGLRELFSRRSRAF
ncbi:ABC transporter permease [Blastopirellula marina]|uniref:ABC transporter permease n=1 Tax=Blastopirellula marina TaxID=124 RepID=UPI001E2A6E43|nr:ABC transporter permease [Blastopirellula marina]